MSHFNFRIMRHKRTKAQAAWYGLHEVYYDENGKPDGWTTNASVVGDTPLEIVRSLELMLNDAKRNVSTKKYLKYK